MQTKELPTILQSDFMASWRQNDLMMSGVRIVELAQTFTSHGVGLRW